MAHSAHVDTFAADHLPPRAEWSDILAMPDISYPERLNCCAAFLDRWVEEGAGERPCLFALDAQWTYRDLFERVNRIANVLTGELGLVPGGRVLLRAANNAMMVATYLAVLKAGGVVVATMPLLRAKEIAFPIEKAAIDIALCDIKLKDEMEKAAALAPRLKHLVYWGGGDRSLEARMTAASPEFTAVDTAADDVCLIAFTSGTTGEPKGTMHFHRDMLAICDSFSKHVLKPTPEDRFIGSAPLGFTFGLGGIVLFPMRVGASFVVIEKAGPDELMAAIERFSATICFTAPTAYRAMLAKRGQHDIGSLRKCVSAGEHLPRATFDAWQAATGLKLIDGIGGTEMLHIFISAAGDDIRPGSTGRPVPGFEAKILDEAGREAPDGTVGRLAVRGPTGCRYLADPRQKKAVRDGWYLTGDAYLRDADGYFWYQARADDMIVSAGYNIAGPEVEAALLVHAAVAECGVVAAPDSERGAIVKAFVVLNPGHTAGAALAKTLQDHVKSEIAPFKYPREIAFVTELPKTSSGKLQRFALRQLAQAQGRAAG